MTRSELYNITKKYKLVGCSKMKKNELISKIEAVEATEVQQSKPLPARTSKVFLLELSNYITHVKHEISKEEVVQKCIDKYRISEADVKSLRSFLDRLKPGDPKQFMYYINRVLLIGKRNIDKYNKQNRIFEGRFNGKDTYYYPIDNLATSPSLLFVSRIL